MSDYGLDLRYLEESKEEPVTVLMQLDPRVNNNQVTQEYEGILIDARELAIDVFIRSSKVPELGMTLGRIMSLPYLGKQETLWSVKTEKGLVLFDHREIEDGIYEVLGANGKIIGKVWLNIPYRTPYGDLKNTLRPYQEIPFFHNLDPDSKFAETMFNLWRADMKELQKVLI